MEEKKKRWRPSLTAYRELEEVVHNQCVELDAWREKYRELVKCKDAEAYQELQANVSTLEQSNRLMEMELRKVQSELELEREVSRVKAAECENLRNRGFWARVFNR